MWFIRPWKIREPEKLAKMMEENAEFGGRLTERSDHSAQDLSLRSEEDNISLSGKIGAEV